MDKPILLTVLSTDTLVDIRDTITAGDSDAYPLSITFSDLTAITGTVRFRFVRGDAYWDRDATIDGNTVSLMLEPDFYAAPGTELWLSFQESNLYTPLHVYFRNIRVPGGNVAAETSQPYPTWVTEVAEAESDRVTAEGLRDDAESDRDDAEGLRESAESDRVTAEANRAVWEEFDPLAVYAVGNKVYYLGSSYICHTASGVAGTLPTDTDYWEIVVQKGDTGEITIGTVTTLDPGESATVTNIGTSTDAVLNIGIPAGYDGSAVPIDDASSAADRVLSAQYIKGQLSAIDTQLADKANKAQEDWITPTFLNGWRGHGAYGTLQYFKDEFGVVHVHGYIEGGTPQSEIFTFPLGYLPKSTVYYQSPYGLGSTSVYPFSVSSDGKVKLSHASAARGFVLFSFKAV